jgi:hypothetical protein
MQRKKPLLLPLLLLLLLLPLLQRNKQFLLENKKSRIFGCGFFLVFGL